MDAADQLALLVFALCLVGSMFFSGSETAITSFGTRRASRAVEEGSSRGRTLKPWVERPVWVLSTILLGNNITNTLMGATATALAIRRLSDSPYADWAVPAAVVVTTALLLVFGEIVPKALGRQHSHKLTVPAMTVLNVMSKLTYPAVWGLAKITEAVVGKQDGGDSESPVTAGELGYLVKVAQREGSIPAEQAALLQGVFRFDEKIVRDIMVPVDRVSAVDMHWSLEKIRETALSTGHSRLPVYVGHVDDTQGVLHIKDLVGLRGDGPHPERVSGVMRAPVFVSESLLIHDLLRRFKEQRVHLAIVVDDAGDTVGVVTLEDVLEQIVGQIFDETDRAPGLIASGDTPGLIYLDGQDSLARVEEGLELEFDDVDEIDGVDSVGDLLTRLAGQMPIAGSVFVVENVRFKVLAADAKRIIRVSAQRVETEATPEND